MSTTVDALFSVDDEEDEEDEEDDDEEEEESEDDVLSLFVPVLELRSTALAYSDPSVSIVKSSTS